MLVDGVGIENQGFSQETLTISQLVMYNFSNRKIVADRKYSNKRHPRHLETPLPTYISLKIYATVRSKTLIDSLFSLGICLPYSRVLDITKDIGIKTLNKYEINDCFVPDNIKNGIFTVVAKDNIDLNARCTIVKSHFHGISMSVLQFPSYFNPGQSQEYNIVKECDFVSTGSKKIPSLPSRYIEIKELLFFNKTPLFSPACTFDVKYDGIINELDVAKIEELKWLDGMIDANSVDDSMSWSKYHSTASKREFETPGINSILPLIKEPVHTLKAQYHCMNLIKTTISNIKILEKVIFNNLYSYLYSNNLITKNQSGFRPGDSTTNQLLYLVNEIHQAFENPKSLEVRAVFLDISKPFDKVWHDGLIFKLKQNGVSGNLLTFFQNYLNNRKQRVVLNGSYSNYSTIESGVPQGSVLGPLLFLIYINDLERNTKSNIKFFAHDTMLFSIVKDPVVSANNVNHDLNIIQLWAHQWKMEFNPDPTKQAAEVLFSCKKSNPNHPQLIFNGTTVTKVNDQKHLGLILDSSLSFEKHLNEKIIKAKKTYWTN